MLALINTTLPLLCCIHVHYTLDVIVVFTCWLIFHLFSVIYRVPHEFREAMIHIPVKLAADSSNSRTAAAKPPAAKKSAGNCRETGTVLTLYEAILVVLHV